MSLLWFRDTLHGLQTNYFYRQRILPPGSGVLETRDHLVLLASGGTARWKVCSSIHFQDAGVKRIGENQILPESRSPVLFSAPLFVTWWSPFGCVGAAKPGKREYRPTNAVTLWIFSRKNDWTVVFAFGERSTTLDVRGDLCAKVYVGLMCQGECLCVMTGVRNE